MTNVVTKYNLLNYDRSDLQAFFIQLGEKAFRGDQVFKWVHQLGISHYDAMTNLSKSMRQYLHDNAEIKLPEVAMEQISEDGTHKWLLRLEDNNCIETVFIPEKQRGTLCVSSQVGCGLNCSFCSTAKQGFNRNLTVAEIVGQLWFAVRRLSQDGTSRGNEITNVVMMGMGEPLLNFDNVVKAMNIMMDDWGYNLSKYRVTLSTSGLIPQMLQLKQQSPVSLAVSLHAANDELRNVLVPLNKKYSLKELMAVCKEYYEGQPKRVVTFEYVMLDNVNDSPQQARDLVKLLAKVPCKLNLIPFNPFPFTEYKCSSVAAMQEFQDIIRAAGIHVTVRKTRGDDIDAACGQLVGKVKDRTQRSVKWKGKFYEQKR